MHAGGQTCCIFHFRVVQVTQNLIHSNVSLFQAHMIPHCAQVTAITVAADLFSTNVENKVLAIGSACIYVYLAAAGKEALLSIILCTCNKHIHIDMKVMVII